MDYLNENFEKIFKYLLNDNLLIVEVHCELIYDVISNINKLNNELECLDEEETEANKQNKFQLMEKAKKLIDFILFLFPKIPPKKTGQVYPLFTVINLIIVCLFIYK